MFSPLLPVFESKIYPKSLSSPEEPPSYRSSFLSTSDMLSQREADRPQRSPGVSPERHHPSFRRSLYELVSVTYIDAAALKTTFAVVVSAVCFLALLITVATQPTKAWLKSSNPWAAISIIMMGSLVELGFLALFYAPQDPDFDPHHPDPYKKFYEDVLKQKKKNRYDLCTAFIPVVLLHLLVNSFIEK